MKKMKGIDFKALLVNHGEKIGAVIVALLGVMGLATAHWSPESRVEEQLVKKANDTKAKMESTTWPDDKRQVFEKTPDVRELTHKMQNPDQDVARYAPSISFSEPLQKMREKRSAPVILAPLYPEASLVTVPLALVPEDEAESKDEKMEGKEKDEDSEKESDEDRERRERLGPIAGNPLGGDLGGGLGGGGVPGGAGLLGGGAGASGPPGMGGGGPGIGGDPRGGGMDPRGGGAGGPPGMGGGMGRGRDPRGGGAGGPPGMGGGGPGMGGDPRGGGMDPRGGGAGGPPGMGGGSGMLGGGGLLGGGGELGDMYGDYSDYSGMLGTNVSSKRIRYAAGVSVRMIFDLREQRKKMAEALQMNPGDPAVAQYAEDFAEIHIERKQAIPAQDEWSGEWQEVLVEDLEESMSESLGFDLEIVNPMVTRPVITMPLPRRVSGRWGKKEASHTQLENFVLTAEEQELIRKRDEKLAREAEERKAKLPPTRKKGGFANLRGNASDYMSSLYGKGQGEEQFYSDFIEDYSNELASEGEGDASSDDSKKKKSKEKLEEMKKKLFSAVDRLLLVRIMDFTAERGQKYIYRIRVEMYNPNYRKPVDSLVTPELADQMTIFSEWSQPSPPVTVPMDYRYYVQKVAGQQGSEESAQLSVYYEVPELGTPVMTDVSVPVGLRIGGEKEIEAVDLAKSVLSRTKVDIKSRDLLASVVEAPKITAGDHPELQAILSKLPRGTKAIPDQVTVVDASGAIILRSAGDASTAQKYDQDDVSFLLKEYEKAGWKRDGKEEGNASDPFNLSGGGEDGGLGAGAGMGAGMGMGSGMGMGYGDPLGGKSGRGRGSRGGRGGRGPGMPGM